MLTNMMRFKWSYPIKLAICIGFLVMIFGSAFTTRVDAADGTPPNIEWYKNNFAVPNGAASTIINDVRQTADGGYIAAGYDYTVQNSENGFILKTTSTGVKQWHSMFFPTDATKVDLEAVCEAGDGGYIAVGCVALKTGTTTTSRLCVVKVNKDGALQWSHSYGDGDGYAYDIIPADGGFVVTGKLWSADGWKGYVVLLKVDQDGNQEWLQRYTEDNMGNYNRGYSVQQTSDGGFVIGGSLTREAGPYNTPMPFGCLIKTDNAGNLLWRQIYSALSDEDQSFVESARETSDGGYILNFRAQDDGPGYDHMFVMKTNSSGSTKWSKSFLLYEPGDTWGMSVVETKDGGFVAAGFANDYPNVTINDGYIVKLDAKGSTIWDKVIDKGGFDYIRSMAQTSDGGFILAGELDKKAYMVKLAPEAAAVEASANAVYQTDEKSVSIVAKASCSECGALTDENVNAASATYTLRDDAGMQVANGNLSYNASKRQWEAIDVDVSAITDKTVYDAKVVFSDKKGHPADVTAVILKGQLSFSSPQMIENGTLLAYVPVTDMKDQPVKSGDVDMKVKLDSPEEEITLKDDGKNGDMYAGDGIYSAWCKISGAGKDMVAFDLSCRGLDSDRKTIDVMNPALVVITDIRALCREYENIGNSSSGDENLNNIPDIYDLLARLNRYALSHGGAVFDLTGEITTENGFKENYSELDYYSGNTTTMSNLIDKLVGVIAPKTLFHNIVIVGDDAVVPFFRKADTTHNEKDYYTDMGSPNNPSLDSSSLDFILTDVPYATYDGDLTLKRPRPDAGFGRIFSDSAPELISIIDGYEVPVVADTGRMTTNLYHLKPDTVEWTALTDNAFLPVLNRYLKAGDIAGDEKPGEYYRYNGQTDAWTADNAKLSLENSTLTLLLAHANHQLFTVPFKDSTDLTADFLNGLMPAHGHFLISAGCHSGYAPAFDSGTDMYDSIIKVLLSKQISVIAPSTYGIGVNDEIAYHDLFEQLYLENLLSLQDATAGDILISSYNDYWDKVSPEFDDRYYTYAAYGMAYYGLPTQPITRKAAKGLKRMSVQLMSTDQELFALEGESSETIMVEIPDFSVSENESGETIFEIPGMSENLINAFAPILPVIEKKYQYPAGTRIKGVDLVAQETGAYEGTVELPIAIPINKSKGPMAGIVDIADPYPTNVFWWTSRESAEKTELTLHIIPLQYSTSTKEVTLYKKMEFTVSTEEVAALSVENTALPDGTVGTAYNAVLTATGGTEPYTWKSTGLPDGLKINAATGVISGTPTAAGEVIVTVTVIDNAGLKDSKSLSLKVNPSNNNHGEDSDDETSSSDSKPAAQANIRDSGGNISNMIPIRLDNGKRTAIVEADMISLSKAFDMSKTDDRGIKTIEVDIPEIKGVKTYETVLPASFLASGDVSKVVEIKTGIAKVKIPGNMLLAANVSGAQNVSISIAVGDKWKLDEKVGEQIGNRPFIELNLKIDGIQTSWSNENAPVTVIVPYTPTAEEIKNHECIIIWHVDGNGKPVCIPNGHYTIALGAVTFTTTHLSQYAVGYNQLDFSDVGESAWYNKAVGFIAARGITTGMGSGNFSPDAKLTRGQFIVMLMRAYEIAPDANSENNFSDAGSTYYTGYLSVAKRLEISAGVGNNMFAPEKEITRQEMFTLLYNTLKSFGKLPYGDTGKPLSSFSDAGDIALWAKDAVTLLVQTGIISGSDGKLLPASTTTRTEMAQVLYFLFTNRI